MTTVDAAAVMRKMVEMFTTGDTSAVGEVVADEYQDHQSLRGIDITGPSGFARVVEVARTGTTGLTVTVEDLIADGDRCAARLRWVGVSSTGGSVDRATIDIIRAGDGKAVEHWGARA